MSKKIYDVVARVGSFIDPQSGEEKGKFENVGAVIENSNGGMNLLLSKTFNPAGLAQPDKESVILSLFEPKPKQGMQQPSYQPQPSPMGAAPQGYVQQQSQSYPQGQQPQGGHSQF